MPLFQSSGSWPKPLGSRVDCCRNEALPLGQTSNKVGLKLVNHVHDNGADRRDEGHDRGRQTHPGDPAARH